MTIADLIQIVSNKLASLNSALATATSLGNLDDIVRLQDEIEATEITLEQLRTL